MGKEEVQPVKIDKVAVVYLLLLSVALFAAYPRVLVYPPGISEDAHFFNVTFEDLTAPFMSRFPVELIVGALSLFYLALNFLKFNPFPRKIVMGLGLFVLSIAGSFLAKGGIPQDVLSKCNYMVVPMAVALSILRSGIFNVKRQNLLVGALSLLWLVSILWSFFRENPTGISGNRNWFVAVLIVTAPWAFFGFYHIFRFSFKRFFKYCNENFLAAAISLAIVGPVSIYWLIRCQSRAAYVALFGYFIFVLWSKFKLKGRIIFALLVVLNLTVSLFSFQSYFQKAYRDDIRGPLWLNTIGMIKQSPGIGWGPGNFQEKYPLFKTREHSVRLVAALMTEHPHNEFLYLAAEIGTPAALLWLIFALLLCFIKVRTREGHLAKFGFLSLLILSMFDKTLISPPANLLFWIFAGILASRWLINKVEFEQTPKFWRWGFGLLAASMMIPVSIRAVNMYQAAEIYRKSSLLEKRVALSKLSGTKRAELYNQAYNGYLDAYEKDPFDVRYPYMALHVAMEILKDPKKGEFPLEACLKLKRNYGHINYLAALYHFYSYRSLQTPKENRDIHKSQVEKFLMNELSLNPDNLEGMEHVKDLFLKLGNRNAVNQVFRLINERILNKIQQKFSRPEAEKLVNEWITLVKNNDSEAVAKATEIFSGVKGIGNIDLLTPFYAAQEGYFLDHDHKQFHKSDLSYWREIDYLTEFYKNSDNAENLFKNILSGITVNSNNRFHWPSEVLNNKQGGELSVACLLRAAAHCQGHLSLLVKINTLDKVHWLVYVKNETEEFFCWPGGGQIIKKKFAAFLSDSGFIEELIGDKIRKKGLFLFEYPQAFCFRNAALSKTVSRVTGSFPDFCSAPSVVKMNLEAYLGGKVKIEYLRQPFHRLEEDIKKADK